MSKLSKRDALLHCFDLWMWLAVTGRYKAEWPEWEHNGGDVGCFDSNCPMCEYVEGRGLDCGGCPINWTEEPEGICTECDSPFEHWSNATSARERKKYALEIAVLALETLFREEDSK